MPLSLQTKIVIVGHGDVIEGSLRAYFFRQGFTAVASVGSFDALNATSTRNYFDREKPEMVILGSVRSGGIAINQTQPAEFIHDNLLAQVNVIDAAYRSGVKKLLFLAASCIYPKDGAQPMRPEYFLSAPMESTSLAYSTAKAAGVVMCQAYRRQYGFNAIVAVPATVYGPGMGAPQIADIAQAHVLGALIGKFERAVQQGLKSVEVWGSGEPRREFIYADDLASACQFLLEQYDGDQIINIGTGDDIVIKDLVAMVAQASGFKGELVWDTSKPDGTMKKLLDSSMLLGLGWKPQVSLEVGVRRVFNALRGIR